MFFLYGPPGSGKTTLGRQLATELDLDYTDLDETIESSNGKDIPTIFSELGESGFRKLERKILTGMLDRPDCIISLGGGALLDGELRADVERRGSILCLQASSDTLLSRLRVARPNRPLLDGDLEGRLSALLASREDHYNSFSRRLSADGQSQEKFAWQAMVALGAFRVRGMGPAYDVRVTPGGLHAVGEMLRQRNLGGPVAVVSDENVTRLYRDILIDSLASAGYTANWVQIPAGERHKTIATVGILWEQFLTAGIERGGTILALGGGVVGDLAGFAAATFLRGVSWVVLPTTLLSMVDASLGGKTGVDLPAGKNLVGAFYPPRMVLADPQVLRSLPTKELRSGMAEVIKHGVIGDPDLFSLCDGFDHAHMDRHMDELVRRAIAVKIDVIQKDPYERGLRAALNLGHTVGHALEFLSRYRMRHGEAVAIGLAVEARIAERMGLAEAGLSGIITAVLRKHKLPTEIPPGTNAEELIRAMRVDKKRSGGRVWFALPLRIGEVRTGISVEDQQILLEVK